MSADVISLAERRRAVARVAQREIAATGDAEPLLALSLAGGALMLTGWLAWREFCAALMGLRA